MSGASFRVYLVKDESGFVTARLISRSARAEPIVSTGMSEEQALERLELELGALDGGFEDFSWDEQFEIGKVRVEVRPEAFVQKRRVIGAQRIPLELSYAWSRLPSETPGGAPSYRVLLPRYDWSLLLEDLGMAADVIKQAVSSALTGENARSLFQFREVANESVVEWRPKLLRKKRAPKRSEPNGFPILNAVAEDWTEQARRGKLGLRLGEPDHATQNALLEARRKPSILLVARSGVGKTAWVKELARRSASTEAAESRVWSTSPERIIAGMVYLGMWEQRCLDVVAELRGEGHFLHVDHVSGFITPRTARSSIAELMLPAMKTGDISVIAECTPEELERAQLVAPAVVAAFQILHLAPLDPESVAGLVHEYQARKNPAANFHPDAVRRLIRHLSLYRKDSAFPGKAFVFLDWFAQPPQALTGTVRPRDADRAFARYSGLPERLISDDEVAPSRAIAAELERGVIGQDDACQIVASVLTRFKAGVNDPDKPIGSLLFVGPTGVGKTELAKLLARFVFGSVERMVRLDMSEYLSPASTLRLTADGPGEQSLATRVAQQPLSLVLLDEIEKAHPAVFDLLLGVLGEGRLTAASGRFVDFRMALIVMTSNLGSGATRVGFDAGPDDGRGAQRAVREHFRPEFFNRLDHVVLFKELGRTELRNIVALELEKLRQREGLKRRSITLSVTSDAEDLLAELGWHPQYGVRPLTRVIEERVLTPIAVEIARKPQTVGLAVRVERDGREIRVTFG